MPKPIRRRKCFVCGTLYDDTPQAKDYGKYGKGGWRSCSPWCQYYERMRML